MTRPVVNYVFPIVLILTAAILALIDIAKSQPLPTPQCFPIKSVLANLKAIGERPIWVGGYKGHDHIQTMLLAHPASGTWTLVTMNSLTDQACIVGLGQQSQPIDQAKPTTY
jgi:hypothetical protein